MALTFNDEKWRPGGQPATLADVHQFDVPLIDQHPVAAAATVADLLRSSEGTEGRIEDELRVLQDRSNDAVRATCEQEIAATWRSIRTRRQPSTIVHALVLRDYQTRAQIAAAIDVGTDEVADRLMDLEAGRIVGSTVNTQGMRVYFLPGLPS